MWLTHRKGDEAQQRILFQKTILFLRIKKWVGAQRPSRRLQRITFQWTSPRDNKGLPSTKSEKSVNLPSLIGTSLSSQVQLNGWTAIYFTFKSIFQKNVAFTNDSFKDREHSLPQSSSAKYKGEKGHDKHFHVWVCALEVHVAVLVCAHALFKCSSANKSFGTFQRGRKK